MQIRQQIIQILWIRLRTMFGCAGINPCPCNTVDVTRSSFAGAPLGRYGFLYIPRSDGPCSGPSSRS